MRRNTSNLSKDTGENWILESTLSHDSHSSFGRNYMWVCIKMDEKKSRFSYLRFIVELIPFSLPWFQEMNDLTFQCSDFGGSNFILLQKRMIPKVGEEIFPYSFYCFAYEGASLNWYDPDHTLG